METSSEIQNNILQLINCGWVLPEGTEYVNKCITSRKFVLSLRNHSIHAKKFDWKVVVGEAAKQFRWETADTMPIYDRVKDYIHDPKLNPFETKLMPWENLDDNPQHVTPVYQECAEFAAYYVPQHQVGDAIISESTIIRMFNLPTHRISSTVHNPKTANHKYDPSQEFEKSMDDRSSVMWPHSDFTTTVPASTAISHYRKQLDAYVCEILLCLLCLKFCCV